MTSLFPPRENRSTSGTHDRSRTAGSISSAVVNSSNPNSGHAVGKRSSSNTRSSRPSQTHQRPSASAAHGSTNDSSSSARETFLNYSLARMDLDQSLVPAWTGHMRQEPQRPALYQSDEISLVLIQHSLLGLWLGREV